MAKKRRKKKQGERSNFIALLILFFILGVASVLLFQKYAPRQTPPPVRVSVPAPVTPPAPPSVPVKVASARLAVLIDDMGANMNKLGRLIDVGEPVTVAVLPYLKHSRATAERAHQAGLEVILHLPMEPKNSKQHSPGQGALLLSMTDEQISALVTKDLASIPFLSGVNNHMGSRFTESERHMKVALAAIGEAGYFFVDSKTSGRSVGLKVARELGLKTVGRDVFLDNERDLDYIRGQFKAAIAVARKNGYAVAIGHPYPETIEVLKEVALELKDDEDFAFVRVSEFVR